MKRILIYGIGNPYRCDDSAGIKVAELLARKLKHSTVDVKWGSIDGLAILDEIVDYDRVFFIDSVKTENGRPGDIHKIDSASFTNVHSFSSHGINFTTALELGRKFNLAIPEKTEIYGIEIEDNDSFSEECTQKVKESIPRVVDAIIQEIGAIQGT
ncbi:hydrogenase maturation protease [candidate division WOR-3 bacterium]|nr:hydrogenase maturation protease [candidate division WOR-3 bacterium]